MSAKKNSSPFLVPPGARISLKKDYDPGYKGDYPDKKRAAAKLQEGIEQLAQYQDQLYAQDSYALLLVFQAMDAAGKDGTIKHVMSGVNPQGCDVCSFKAPSVEELNHDYLWRCGKRLPERGRIGIFNRSYYEEVLIVRVHPGILKGQKLPDEALHGDIWKHRYTSINDLEKHLHRNGTRVVKFFLHLSKEEQRKRFLARVEDPNKNWKFSQADIEERGYWKDYQRAYEECLSETSTETSPWYAVPADDKDVARLVISEVILKTLDGLKMSYPRLDKAGRKELLSMHKVLSR